MATYNNLNPDFRLVVARYEEELGNAKGDAQVKESRSGALSSECSKFEQSLAWYDKFLFGILGGSNSRKKNAHLRHLKKQYVEFYNAAEQACSTTTQLDKKIVQTVDQYLRANDGTYRHFITTYDAAEAVAQESQYVMQKIDDALEQIDDARFADTIDMASGSKMGIWAYFENSDAKEKIDKVSYAIGDFQKAVTNYKTSEDDLSHLNITNKMGSGTFITLTLAFDNIFMDLTMLSRLSDAKDDLNKLRDDIGHITQSVQEHAKPVRTAMADYIKQVRQACL